MGVRATNQWASDAYRFAVPLALLARAEVLPTLLTRRSRDLHRVPFGSLRSEVDIAILVRHHSPATLGYQL